jgi:glycosyltransferase involved in cell wall biosynthesis
MRPVRGPWGGSSPFVSQLEQALRRRGYSVAYSLRDRPDVAIIIDPRDDLPRKGFGMDELRDYKQRQPQTQVIHRINECDQRKGTKFMDSLLKEANSLADHTVFISQWLRDYFVERWFDPARPHSVIYNGASPSHFHPIGASAHKRGEPWRVVTHHWSDNPLKGFDVYESFDELIASGALQNVEFWVIGRWPQSIQWKAAKTFGPQRGPRLGNLLRQCHLYLTASRWEPCGMHHVEGAQCGLPLLYHQDGGGIVEAGEKYGVAFRAVEELRGAFEEARARYDNLRGKVLALMPSGERMCLDYADIIQRLIAARCVCAS